MQQAINGAMQHVEHIQPSMLQLGFMCCKIPWMHAFLTTVFNMLVSSEG